MHGNLPKADWFLNKELPSRPDIVIRQLIKSGNDGHVFKGHADSIVRDWACKVIPRTNLVVEGGREVWRSEVLKANSLTNTAVVKFEQQIEDWKDEEAGVDCVVLVSEFVEGCDLKDFIAKNKGKITVSFVTSFLSTMLNLFIEMKVRGVTHGDLHVGNILVQDRPAYDRLGPRYVFRVTDFGVAEATSDRRFKDDFDQLADILRQLLEQVDYTAGSLKEKFTFNVLNDKFLARYLTERDTTREPFARQPEALFQQLQEIETEFDKYAGEGNRLLTPFDFLNCEQIGDDESLLKSLYSDRFLGLDDIRSRNNVVVTGPRGCGKSTVFKSLSLHHKSQVGEDTPAETQFLGVYYRCLDLYFAFPRYLTPTRPEALDIPVHFVTATLLAGFCDVFERWALRHFPEEYRASESKVAIKLWDILGIEPPKEPGAETLRAIAAELQKQRRKAAERQQFAHDPKRGIGRCWGVDILQRACEALVKSFSFSKSVPVYFFIDDYSAPKVTKALQSSLNRIFMQRNPHCFFKLSTESPVSFSSGDMDGVEYVEGREFFMLNLGLVYLHDETDKKRAFIEDVFRRRLSAVENYPAKDITELVGSNPSQNWNEDAKQIRRAKRITIWGKESLSNLCSGDIHYVINLVASMVNAAGGETQLRQSKNTPKVLASVQDKCIREEAGEFLRNLKGSCEYGDKLVAIASAFGIVANSYLKFRISTNEKGEPPWQACRIEPHAALSLTPAAQKLYDELLRYSVFIEDYRGKSRRGKTVPRLCLRRFLVPYFNLTFSNRDSIPLEPADIELLLTSPDQFESKFRRKGPDEHREGELPLRSEKTI
jgi:serine/threonine protein kinase